MKRHFLLLFLVGCAPTAPPMDPSLMAPTPGWRFEVVPTFELVESGPGGNVLSASPAAVEFEGLRFDITPGRTEIALQVANQHNATVRIPLDDAAFVDLDGSSSRLVTGHTRMVDAQRSQPPAVIAPRSRLELSLFPTRYLGRGGPEPFVPWHTRVAYQDSAPAAAEAAPDLFDRAEELHGRRLGVILPVEVDGQRTEYSFWFEVSAEVAGPFRMGGNSN